MDQKMRAILASLLFASLVLFPLGPQALADNSDNNVWRISNAFGSVWIVVDGVQHASLAQMKSLKPGDSIRTGQNGRVLLVHGEEFILVSPNSSIEIAKDDGHGLSTKIIQRAGSIVLDVEKRNVKHFEVDTPLLAALVKGTRFRVTVAKDDAYVDVLRGQVEVSNFKTGQYALVNPGQSAKVEAHGPAGLFLSGSGTLSTIQQGSPRHSPVDVEPVAVERRSTADDTSTRATSSKNDGGSIPPAPALRTAKVSLQRSTSASPVQPAEVENSKTSNAASRQGIVVASLLNESNFTSPMMRGIGDTFETFESGEDNLRLVPWIVGIAVTVSLAVAIRRRWKRRRQPSM